MTHKMIFTSLVAIGILLSLGLAMAQSPASPETTASSFQSSALTPVVGQRCTVSLVNGETVKGTLWAVDNEFLSMKVRKALLYSKTEKYSIAEVSFVEDESGKRYFVSPGTATPEGTETALNSEAQNTPVRSFDSELVATPLPRSGQTAVGKAEDKTMRVLNYRLNILFGVAVFAIGLVVFLKMIGMKGSAYGKHSLFPARVVRISGQYGIIDQGKNDGVKKDDIIRLYRKKNRKIQFKAKVKVISIESSYSAVEVVKSSRRIRPEVGDVGFRDRNFVASGFKVFRSLSSAFLKMVAKVLEFASRRIEVNEVTPVIKIDKFNNEVKVEKIRPAARTKSKSSAKNMVTETKE
jgi:small nuclear ribonucleoprotein (snRNP)-like protein